MYIWASDDPLKQIVHVGVLSYFTMNKVCVRPGTLNINKRFQYSHQPSRNHNNRSGDWGSIWFLAGLEYIRNHKVPLSKSINTTLRVSWLKIMKMIDQ